MKKSLLLLSLFISSTIAFAQITFEKGYIIDNNDLRTECLIKNSDWKNNPTEFAYKTIESDKPQKGDISTVKEFGIEGECKYVRADVKIDRSSNDYYELSTNRHPVWQEQTLYLNALVQGDADLFQYTDGCLIRFFYSINDSSINQLVCKEYLANNSERLTGYNNAFRQQLWIDVNCEKRNMSTFEHIAYTPNALTNVFVQYNACKGNNVAPQKTKEKKQFFNLKLSSGIDLSSATISNEQVPWMNVDFGKNTSYNIGLDAEFMLPFNKNKWSVTIEPSYHYFTDEQELARHYTTIDYKAIELAMGLRHYFYLSGSTKLFINAHMVTSNSTRTGSKLTYSYNPDLTLKSRLNFALGVGAEYKRLGFETRFYTPRDIMGDYAVWIGSYNRMSFVLGYKLIKAK